MQNIFFFLTLKNGSFKNKYGWKVRVEISWIFTTSFQSSLVSIIGATSYSEAIRETILCGGDSCTRGILIGACLGAKFGIQSIPEDWLKKVDGMKDIIEKSIKCFSQISTKIT